LVLSLDILICKEFSVLITVFLVLMVCFFDEGRKYPLDFMSDMGFNKVGSPLAGETN